MLTSSADKVSFLCVGLRSALKILTAIPTLGVVLVVARFTALGQALHDLLSGTVVVSEVTRTARQELRQQLK